MKSPKFTMQEMSDAVPIKQDGWTERDACEWTAAFVNGATVDRMKEIIADDAFAISFQTMGQYRSAILKILTAEFEPEIPYPYGCKLCNVATGCDGSC